MEKIMTTSEGINLLRDETTNRFYSSDPKAIIKALEEDLKSDDLLTQLCAASVKDMVKSSDGRIYRMKEKSNICVHIVVMS